MKTCAKTEECPKPEKNTLAASRFTGCNDAKYAEPEDWPWPSANSPFDASVANRVPPAFSKVHSLRSGGVISAIVNFSIFLNVRFFPFPVVTPDNLNLLTSSPILFSP